jgi:hypothetical protein
MGFELCESKNLSIWLHELRRKDDMKLKRSIPANLFSLEAHRVNLSCLLRNVLPAVGNLEKVSNGFMQLKCWVKPNSDGGK